MASCFILFFSGVLKSFIVELYDCLGSAYSQPSIFKTFMNGIVFLFLSSACSLFHRQGTDFCMTKISPPTGLKVHSTSKRVSLEPLRLYVTLLSINRVI